MIGSVHWKFAAAASVLSTTLLMLTSGPVGAWSYKEAAQPYAGTTITILDEVTPLQEAMKKLVAKFTAETGIKVNYELLSHPEVISKGQADMLSGRGAYDAVMLHSPQMGLLLSAKVLRPIDTYLANSKLTNPDLDSADFIDPGSSTLAKFGANTYGFLTWNYNQVYWARGDLLNHPEEKAAFKAKYGYDLAPAATLEQMRDIAAFFTRAKGAKLAGETLSSDFYGIVLEGIRGGTTFWSVWNNFIRNWGGDLFDAEGKPTFDRPENVAAVQFWADLWKSSPPGQAEYSLIDVPTVMGNGIAAQTIAWSDFVLGIDTPKASKLHGKFVYAGIPPKVGQTARRQAETEPSLVAISTHSRAPEATYLFLQWMVDKATQKDLIGSLGGGVPVRNSSWGLPQIKDSPNASLFKAMSESLRHGYAKPRAAKLYEIADVAGAILQDIATGKITAAAGMKAAQEKVLGICQKCFLTAGN
ncbi:MAG: extracellular solute-binding protein [Hyphomonadaceae bacterium]|nr:extracellular solute-binding protein [Hyphomonadaceae bacterium]